MQNVSTKNNYPGYLLRLYNDCLLTYNESHLKDSNQLIKNEQNSLNKLIELVELWARYPRSMNITYLRHLVIDKNLSEIIEPMLKELQKFNDTQTSKDILLVDYQSRTIEFNKETVLDALEEESFEKLRKEFQDKPLEWLENLERMRKDILSLLRDISPILFAFKAQPVNRNKTVQELVSNGLEKLNENIDEVRSQLGYCAESNQPNVDKSSSYVTRLITPEGVVCYYDHPVIYTESDYYSNKQYFPFANTSRSNTLFKIPQYFDAHLEKIISSWVEQYKDPSISMEVWVNKVREDIEHLPSDEAENNKKIIKEIFLERADDSVSSRWQEQQVNYFKKPQVQKIIFNLLENVNIKLTPTQNQGSMKI